MKLKKTQPGPDDLSPSEYAVMRFLQEYLDTHPRPPTIRQIAEQVSLSTGGTADVVRRLEDYGYLVRRRGKSRRMVRSIRLKRCVPVPARIEQR